MGGTSHSARRWFLRLENKPAKRRRNRNRPRRAFTGLGTALFNPDRRLLGPQAQFGRLERMLLSHGIFGSMQTIKDQFSEKGKAHLPVTPHMVLTFLVHQKQMISFQLRTHIQILAQLNVTFGA
jgi:hypothetical protein